MAEFLTFYPSNKTFKKYFIKTQKQKRILKVEVYIELDKNDKASIYKNVT